MASSSNGGVYHGDDTKIYGKVGQVKVSENMREDFDTLCKWSEKWQMKFNIAKDFDQSLLSLERLDDRTSPDLWPEQMPGMSDFAALSVGVDGTDHSLYELHLSKQFIIRFIEACKVGRANDVCAHSMPQGSPPSWLAEVESCDADMLHEFGSLTTSQLVEKVRGLQELAFQLGLEEAHEMVRGKFLNILSRPVQKRAP